MPDGVHVGIDLDQEILPLESFDDRFTGFESVEIVKRPSLFVDPSIGMHDVYKFQFMAMSHCKVIRIMRRCDFDSTRAEFRIVVGIGETWHLEIRIPGDDKGTGLERLRRTLGIAREEVLAAGDWLNDVALLEAAGVGVAMRGAPEALVRRAAHVTPGSSDEDGLAAFLESFFDL